MQQPLDYMSHAEDRPRGWLAADVAIAVLAAVVVVANAWLVRITYSDTDDWAGFIVRLFYGPLANAAMTVVSLVIAGLWKFASPETRLRGFAIAALVFLLAGYLVLAVVAHK